MQGCDESTQRHLLRLFNIEVEEQWVIKNFDGQLHEVVLTNKRDQRFCQAMENDVELTWSMRDIKGDNYVLR